MINDLIFIIVVILISGFLGFLIAWFWRTKKHKEELENCESKYDDTIKQKNNDINELKAELDECKKNVKAGGGSKSVSQNPDEPSFDADTAAKVLGYKKVMQDDLKIIEGIGPKIEEILKKNGIDTWKKLSEAKPDEIKKILIEKGGERFKMHDPSTWPKQAELAYKGKWEELKKWQDQLNGGKE